MCVPEKHQSEMKIAFIGNYPPKACGIGTFTENLANSILANLAADHLGEVAEIIAMEDPSEAHTYPSVVTRTIDPNELSSYRKTAAYLNEGDFDLVVLQHEYGIFGGDDGSYILTLLNRLKIPLITTFHTVLKQPSPGQRNVLRSIAGRSQQVVVMSQMARSFLQEIFEVPDEKIAVIEHGVPIVESEARPALRERLGWADKKVIFTFGLLGRGKGIETAVRALPKIVMEHPDTHYVVLGKTHPHVVRDSGEEYREYLHQLADDLGVGDHLEMIAEFATEQKLFDYLRACDLYVIPYPNEAQITSGTLAYAVGAGTAILSTPFWHATELLEDGRGHLFDFHDSRQLAQQANALLNDEKTLRQLRLTTSEYGKDILWPKVGAQYLETIDLACKHYEQQRDRHGELELPELDLQHLYRFTDDVGILQHGKYSLPNRHEGYCLDDNGRALLLVAMLLENDKVQDRQRLEELAEIYTTYIYHAQNEDGSFRNFMSYDRRFLEKRGSEDSFGRAFWAIGYCLAHPPRPDLQPIYRELFDRSIHRLEEMHSPRTVAYGILGLSYFLDARPGDEFILNKLQQYCQRLVDGYRHFQRPDWQWFEPYLTYSNGILPYALFRALRHLDRDDLRNVAERTTEFLTEKTVVRGVLRPVGCLDWYHIGKEQSRFDQQPVDAMGKVLLFEEACRHGELQTSCNHVLTAFEWFIGKNDLDLPLYEPQTGGCYDGLMKTGLNRNQGAESLISYLISRVVVERYLRERGEEDEQTQQVQGLLASLSETVTS